MVFDLAGGRRRGLFASVAGAVTLLLGLSLLSPVAALADEDEGLLSPVLVQLKKEVAPSVAGPNEVVTYTIGVNCSDLETDCVNLRVEDTIPAPLTLLSVALNTNAGDPDAPTASVSTVGNSFTVRATTDLGGGNVGLVAGSSLEFTALARVPAGVSADYHGDSVTNTAFARLDNRDSDQQDSADLLLNVPDVLAATIDKTITPSTVSGVTATPVTVTLDAVNASNRAVDALVIQDPSSASTLFTYAQVSGITVPTWPSGANRVQVDWYNGTTWTNGTPQASIGMPSGVTASSIRGLRFTFTSTTGAIAQGARAVVAIATTLRSSVTSLGGDVAATNHASAVVRVGGTSTTPVSDSAGLTIRKVSLSPVGAKTFTPDSVVGGRPTQVMLTATNGGNFALKSLTITEPATGTPDLAAQGLGFGGWVADGVEWPVGATAASVRFLYAGDADFATAVGTTERNTLPSPEPDRTVIGFTVSFTGTSMGVGQYAKVPYTATTVAVDADVTRTNTIAVDVVATDNQTATASAADDLTLRTARVRTTTGKQLTPGTIYGVGGAYTIVALPSRIDPAPAGPAFTDGSTVGATRFVIADDSATFWDAFDLSAIVSTDVPAGTTMLVEYWDGETWSPLDASDDPVQGPTTYGRTLTAPERAAVQGIRFVFEPASAGAELPPGFNVQPNLKATLRTALRSDPGTPAAGAATDLVVVNDVRSEVTNPAATPPVADSATSASVTVRAVPGGSGGGIDLLGKTWSTASSTGIKAVLARSNDRISSTISWGTGGLPFDSVTITDSQADEDGEPGAVATTVFDAFDLVSVAPITPTMDPLLRYDRVTAVELFVAGEWVPTASNPCAGSACDGAFPGYVLTADERAAATSVRLVFEESPTRASRIGGDPLAPTVGSGVAATMDRSRQIVLVFEVRDERRSNGEAVLGTTRGTVYNAAPGFVRNTASIAGLAADGSTRTDTGEDSVQILDRAINTSATQAWIDGPLGIPPAGTDQAYFPTAQMTLSGQNTSVVKVDELRVAEPSAGTTPFEYLDITDIVSITVPTGATASTVILHRPAADEAGPSTETLTIAQALALTAADLADVIGIEVVHTGRIAAAQRTTIVLKTRLREDVRSSGAPMTARTVQSIVTSSVTDPAGLAAPETGTDNTVLSTATASLAIEAWSYGVDAHKYVTADTAATPTAPAIQYVGSSTKATVNLTAQPTGNVRTTRMVIEDSSPTFWNAMNFDGFGSHAFASPINRVQVAVLVGVEYDLVGGELVATCDGSTDLEGCWITDPTPRSTLALPAGSFAKSDIRGIRFIYTRADFAQWDRPFNPLQTVTFTVDRRSTLVFGDGGGSTSPVPSTLYIYPDPAPGETERATFSNEVTVTAALATTPTDTSPLWVAQDTDAKQLRLQHLPARVQVTKAPYGGQSLGSDIPFVITVKNTGGTGDKPLTGVVVVDQLPGDAQGPLLVFPPDPDTGAPVAPASAFAYRLLDAAGVPQTVPAITGTAGTPSPDGRTLTFTMPAGSSIPLGWTLEITATLQFRERLEATTDVVNTVTVTSDQQFDTCDATRDAGVVLPTLTEVADCSTTTLVRPLPSAPMTIIKGVRGVAAGPLDATGAPLLDGDGQPYDDLGVLKTQPTSPVDCTAPSLAIAGEDYYRYPCVPITRPGAEEEWAARFTNSGNVRVGRVVAIDVLPAANDTGVIIADSRGSKWSALLSTYPQLSGAPADATLTVYAATAAGIATARCNGADIQHTMGMATSAMVAAYQTCMTDTGKADDVPNRAWSVLSPSASPAELAAVVALKFVVTTATGIAPSEAIAITYRSTTAAVPQLVETDANLGRDSVAYNSIAGAAVGVNGFDSEGNPIDLAYRFVTEPRKVGVALATGQLRLLKTVTGTAASGFKPTSFKLEVSCTSAGTPIELRSSTGALRSPFTVTAGTELLVRGVPLYASCVVTENTDYGQTTKTISPSTVVAQADQQAQSGSTVENPRPAFGTATRPAIPLVTVTNTYTSASLVVSKTVDTGGAAVTYKPSSFTVACTHDRGAGPVSINLGSGNASFTLAAGASRTISNLVSGAVCTVTESNTQGALATSTIVTQNGSSGTSTTGVSRVISLAPAANTIAFANAYGIGTLNLRKTVTGAGADTWGNRSFVFAVTCTNPYTATATVFSGEVTLTKSGTDQLGDHVVSATIPGGSSCSVVETGSGGATAVTTPSAVTVAAGGSQTLVVTNRFDLASVTIAKSVETDAADQQGDSVYVADEYEFDVLCTWQGSTVLDTTVVVARGDEETVTGLPVGAACDIDELDAFGADSTTMTTAQGSVSGTSTSIAALVAGDNRVAVTNRYGVTAFTVTKQTLGDAATVLGGGEFAMHVRCLAPGGAVAFEDDIALVAGESITIEQLADGSVCSVEETGDGGADDSAVVFDDDDVVDAAGVTVSTENPGHATVRNWFLTGAVQVTKVLEGDAAAFATGPFTVSLACTADGEPVAVDDADRHLVPGAMTTTFTGLPSGAECVLSETERGGASSTRIGPADGPTVAGPGSGFAFDVIVDGSSRADDQPQPALEVVNSYDRAGLVVSKTVDSDAVDAAGTPIAYGPFPVEVRCTFEGDPVYAAGYDAEHPMTAELTPGAPWTIDGLVSGATCEVVETDVMDADRTGIDTVIGTTGKHVPGAGTSFTLAPSDGLTIRNTVEIENHYDSGSLSIAKAVTGDAADWATAPFTVRVVCELDDATGVRTVWDDTFDIAAGAPPVLLEGIASGAVCEITETRTGGATSTGIAVGDADAVAGTQTTLTSPVDAATEVTITNDFAASTVSVTKDRTGASELYGEGPFVVSLACTWQVDGQTVPIAVPGGATRTLEAPTYAAEYAGLPRDAACELTETRTGGATSSTVSEPEFTLDRADVPVTVTNDFAVGTIAVDKTVDGAGAALYGEGPFTVSLACEREVDGAAVPVVVPGGAERVLESASGYTAEYADLPAGADCLLTETRTGGASAASGPIELSVVADTVTPASLVNTFGLGELRVKNVVTGSAWEPNSHHVFVVELSCTLDVDGKEVELEIPGGAVRDITHLEEIAYLQLPIGAICTLVELQSHGADRVTITGEKAGPATIDVGVELATLAIGEEPVTFDVVNVFELALARTGLDPQPIVLLALLSMLFGAALVVARRRDA